MPVGDIMLAPPQVADTLSASPAVRQTELSLQRWQLISAYSESTLGSPTHTDSRKLRTSPGRSNQAGEAEAAGTTRRVEVLLTSLASGSAGSSLGGRGPALLPGPPAAVPPSVRGDSSSCSRLSWSGELHLELNSGESGRCGGLGGGGGRDGECEGEAGVGGPSTGAWDTP